MSTIEIISKIETLKEYEALQVEATAMVESIRDEIKRHMDAIGAETLEAGRYIVRFATVQSSRFDARRFKNDWGRRFTRTTAKRSFPAASPSATKKKPLA